MAVKSIHRASGTTYPPMRSRPNANDVRVDSADEKLKYVDGASTIHSVVTEDQTQTLTAKTLTAPTITAPVISGAGTISGQIAGDVKVTAANFDMASGGVGSTLANVTGLTAFALVAGATYRFRLVIPHAVMTTNGGLKMAFKLTTATLTSVNFRVRQSTDTDNTGAISTNFTATTDQATWFDQKAVVYTNVTVDGTLVVLAGGTIAVQAAQNTAHADTSTIDAGAFAEFIRLS